jgi:hypothetical protein
MPIVTDEEILKRLAAGESEEEVAAFVRRETRMGSDLEALQVVHRAQYGPNADDDIIGDPI